jgi:predicted dehydrogenase
MMKRTDRVRIGVIGIGHLGNYHLQKYQQLSDCEIVGVVDTVEERSSKAAEIFNCDAFVDHRSLIDKVDAVSIAVPTGFHHEVAKDFLSEGIDVLLEKPIAVNLEQADELISIADSRGALLQIGFVERFNPAIEALEKVIGEPLFIEAHRLHPFFERGTDVDVILDLMIHDLDMILNFVKSPLKNVDAVGISVLSDNVDISNARITFQNGCVANVTASRVTGKVMQKIRFFGLEGYHSVDYGKRELVSLRRRIVEGGATEISANTVGVEDYDPLEREIRTFIQSVVTRSTPLVSGSEGRKSLELALRIVEAMNKGQGMIS